MKLNNDKCKEMPMEKNKHHDILIFTSYLKSGDRTAFHLGLFFQ